jgi:hypothetical protein
MVIPGEPGVAEFNAFDSPGPSYSSCRITIICRAVGSVIEQILAERAGAFNMDLQISEFDELSAGYDELAAVGGSTCVRRSLNYAADYKELNASRS